jgi:hypothetical protein
MVGMIRPSDQVMQAVFKNASASFSALDIGRKTVKISAIPRIARQIAVRYLNFREIFLIVLLLDVGAGAVFDI